MCKICKLDTYDLENMTVAMAINHIEEYTNIKNPNAKKEAQVIEFADEVPWL